MASHGETSELAVDDLRRRARRRLVGAAILALTAAVLLPLLLESEPKPLGDDVSIQIPSQETGASSTAPGSPKRSTNRAALGDQPGETPSPATLAVEKTVPGNDMAAKDPALRGGDESKSAELDPGARIKASDSGGAAGGSAASAPSASGLENRPVTGPAEALPTSKRDDRVAPTSTTKATPGPAPSSQGFVVQLAAFGDPAAAGALVGQLKTDGFSAYAEPLMTSRGSVHRVRVGPYASREAAESAQTRLKRGGHKGIVARANR